MMEHNFHIPDFVRHFRLNLILAEYMKDFPERFRDGARIASIYGAFPNMLWNGGRYIAGPMDPRIIKEIIGQFNSRGIALRAGKALKGRVLPGTPGSAGNLQDLRRRGTRFRGCPLP
jgi:hypothetical protein